MADPLTPEAFEAVDIRVGCVVDAQPFPEARKPAIKLWVDFGAPLGNQATSMRPHFPRKPHHLLGCRHLQVERR